MSQALDTEQQMIGPSLPQFDFILEKERYKGSSAYASGFRGCSGSSREHLDIRLLARMVCIRLVTAASCSIDGPGVQDQVNFVTIEITEIILQPETRALPAPIVSQESQGHPWEYGVTHSALCRGHLPESMPHA
ncbi:hypothetical protein EDD21DRAFT_350529 [Dissophora ornata]|nr:hypothetical protein EDD21DRAFT_350529 [Dissophora ornata]